MDVTLDAVPEQDRLSKPSAAAVVTKFEQRKEHRSVVCCNHHSWMRPTKLNTAHERIALAVLGARFPRNMLELSTKVHGATFFKNSEQTNRLEKKNGLRFAIEKTAKTKKNMA